MSGGVYVIGVEDKTLQVKGLIMSQADQSQFRARLTSWMTADDAGTQESGDMRDTYHVKVLMTTGKSRSYQSTVLIERVVM